MLERINSKIFQLRNIKNGLVGGIRRNSVGMYWWCPAKKNFGDLINEDLIAFYGYTPVYRNVEDAQIICIGSILEMIKEQYSGVVLGSGFMYPETERSYSLADIVLVRGKETKRRIHSVSKKSIPLGDPGILASSLYGTSGKKKYRYGILPHYSDIAAPAIQEARVQNLDIILINPKGSPGDVARKISECECILSSSLHGLIVSDSLGIKNKWILLNKNKNNSRWKFKFQDYYSSFGRTEIPCGVFSCADLNEAKRQARMPGSEVREKVDEISAVIASALRDRFGTRSSLKSNGTSR